MRFLYEIINFTGTVEHVGETNCPERRLKQHFSKPGKNGNGKFYKRQDVIMHVIPKVYINRSEILEKQYELQKEWGLLSDKEICSFNQIGKKVIFADKEQWKKSISESKKGKKRKPFTEDHKKKISEAKKGKKRTNKENHI